MGSTTMSDEDKSAIENAVGHLLGRAVWHRPWPLTGEETQRLWIRTFPPEIQLAWDTLAERDYELHSDSLRHGVLVIGEADASVHLHTDTMKYETDWPPMLLKCHNIGQVAMILPAYRGEECMHGMSISYADLLDWARYKKDLSEQTTEAWNTFMELLEMANTPGHLKRMCPDIIPYLAERTRKKIGDRQSPMPSGFTTFDRDKVYRLCHTLAKCHLLPEVEGVDFEKKHFVYGQQSLTWVKI